MLCRVLTDCSKKEPFSLQGSKDAYAGWEACCYLQSIPPHVTALLCHGGVGGKDRQVWTRSVHYLQLLTWIQELQSHWMTCQPQRKRPSHLQKRTDSDFTSIERECTELRREERK